MFLQHDTSTTAKQKWVFEKDIAVNCKINAFPPNTSCPKLQVPFIKFYENETKLAVNNRAEDWHLSCENSLFSFVLGRKKKALEKGCEKEKSHCPALPNLLVQYLSNIMMTCLCTKVFLTLWSSSCSPWVVLDPWFCSTARRRDLLQGTKTKAPVLRKKEPSSPERNLGKG